MNVPFQNDQHVFETGHQIWESLEKPDWLEAFAAHPRIGDLDSLRRKYADTKDWSAAEQQGVETAVDATLVALGEANRRYESLFGHRFIVCATGKSAEEMLELLHGRLLNPPELELENAAREQWKITVLRLRKLGDD